MLFPVPFPSSPMLRFPPGTRPLTACSLPASFFNLSHAHAGSLWVPEGSGSVLSAALVQGAGPRAGEALRCACTSTGTWCKLSGAFSCPPENMCKWRFFPEAYHVAKSMWFLTRTEKGTYPVRTGSRFRSFSKSRSKLGALGLLNETE